MTLPNFNVLHPLVISHKKGYFDTFSVYFKVRKLETKIVQHNGYHAAPVTFQLSSCVDARARASQPTRARRLCAACLSLLRPFSRASKVSFVPSVPLNGHIFPLSPLREPDIIYRTFFVSGKRGPQRWRTPCLTAHNQPCFSQPPSLSHLPVNVFPSSSPNCEKTH